MYFKKANKSVHYLNACSKDLRNSALGTQSQHHFIPGFIYNYNPSTSNISESMTSDTLHPVACLQFKYFELLPKWW